MLSVNIHSVPESTLRIIILQFLRYFLLGNCDVNARKSYLTFIFPLILKQQVKTHNSKLK